MWGAQDTGLMDEELEKSEKVYLEMGEGRQPRGRGREEE